VDNQKATLEARENEIAKLKHEVIETRKEMTDGISMIRRRAASMTTDEKNSTTSNEVVIKKSASESDSKPDEPFLIVSQVTYGFISVLLLPNLLYRMSFQNMLLPSRMQSFRVRVI
jgi:hypothetical protein